MYEYAIIVKSKTRLELLIEKYNSKNQAKFAIESCGGDFVDYELEHDEYQEALESVQQKLSQVLKTKLLDRSFVSSFMFSPKQVIVVVGQDGLVANVAKYSKGQPILGVNPMPHRFMGVLVKWKVGSVVKGVKALLAAARGAEGGTGSAAKGAAIANALEANSGPKLKKCFFAKAELSDGQTLLAFNDLFIGAKSHVSARYEVSFNGVQEMQSSSGMVVSTKQGSTGWMSSMFHMAYGVARFQAKSAVKSKGKLVGNSVGNDLSVGQVNPQAMMGADELMFCVREPYVSQVSFAEVVMDRIQPQQKLLVESKMPENGVIFSDGVESDFLKFCSGTQVKIGLADEYCLLLEP